VSSHLHHWIDLIFGYQQQGDEALKANNLFHYLTYEGAFNPDFVRDPEELAAIELQIKEFGQTPKQLFTKPHPRKTVVSKVPGLALNSVEGHTCSSGATTLGLSITTDASPTDQRQELSDAHTITAPAGTAATNSTPSTDCCDDWVHIDTAPDDTLTASTGTCSGSKCLTLKHMEKVHKEAVSAVSISHDGKSYFSVSNDRTIKVHTMEDNQLLRSSNVSNLPLSSLVVLPGSTIVLIGSWDNNVYTYSTEYAAVVNSEYCHHSSVTSLSWRHGTMATGSWDSTVKIWTLPFDPSCHKPDPAELQCELDHDNEVTCIDLDCDALRVASGTVDGYVTVWSIADEERDFELQAHNDGVCALKFNPDGSRLCTCGGDSIVRVLDPTSKIEVISKRAPETLHCVVWLDGHLVLGGESGDIHVWKADTLQEIARHKAHSGTVTCLHLSTDGSVLVSGSKDKCVGVWLVTSNVPTHKQSSVVI
jgi:factor associated with neutral sphingomyelinase activation